MEQEIAYLWPSHYWLESASESRIHSQICVGFLSADTHRIKSLKRPTALLIFDDADISFYTHNRQT